MLWLWTLALCLRLGQVAAYAVTPSAQNYLQLPYGGRYRPFNETETGSEEVQQTPNWPHNPRERCTKQLPLQAKELGSPTEQTKQLSEAEEKLVYTTLKGNETERMWVTDRVNTPSNRSWEMVAATPSAVNVNSSSASEERLPKATITISSVNGTCNVTLYCSNTGEGENVTYAWSYSHESVVLSEEQTLRITQKPEDGSLNYTCTVRNMESENSGTVSLTGHCHDAPPLNQHFSASIYTKYWVPPLVVLVLLLFLFLMYRRKRGRASLSRTVSINESSDSDDEDFPDTEQAAQLDPLPQAWKQIPEDSSQITGAPATEDDEETVGAQDQPLNQA